MTQTHRTAEGGGIDRSKTIGFTFDGKNFTAYAAGQNCANCRFYQGRPADPWGGCGALDGKLVNPRGWCVAWVKKI